jgi:hypothetical protein
MPRGSDGLAAAGICPGDTLNHQAAGAVPVPVEAAHEMGNYPNLRRRPATPSKGRGPIQVRIRRAFIASGAGPRPLDGARGRLRKLG